MIDVLNDKQRKVVNYLAQQRDEFPDQSIFEVYGRLWVGDARVPSDVQTAFTLLSAEEQNTVGAYMALTF
ncbi:hypothetical protein [Lacticaseibacillus sp. 866-1]|uniref:hypothetical protein n=1 Tax=Lacticaseibacillus sp. 866-1 TaxID=2799576 RepID=UPI0019442144|nr:hypothetical protein [Lacticaseibacillus sp. 866-1]